MRPMDPICGFLPPDLQYSASFPDTQDQPANSGFPGGLSAEQLGGTALHPLGPSTHHQHHHHLHQLLLLQQQRSHVPHLQGVMAHDLWA